MSYMGKGRKVKCKATGEYGNSNDFYKTSKGYFKTKEVYEEFQREANCRKQIIEMLAELMEYQKGEPLPPIILTELKRLKFYKNQVILKTIEQEYNAILKACSNKTFNNSVAQGRYIFAIIKNNISDVNRRFEIEQKEEERIKHNMEVATISNDPDMPVQKQQNKDLTMFVEE